MPVALQRVARAAPRAAAPRTRVAVHAGAVVSLGALTACAVARTQLAAPAPDARRETVVARGGSCPGDRCTARVDVGGRRLAVGTHTRAVSPAAVAGRPAPSVFARARRAAANALSRRLGGTTTGLQVVQGTRTVDAPGAGGAGRRLTCAVVAIHRERQTRVDDSTQTIRTRLATGLACRTTRDTTGDTTGDTTAHAAPPDSARGDAGGGAHWLVRRGIATGGPALAAVLDSVQAIDARAAGDDEGDRAVRAAAAEAPLTLERVAGPGGDVARYTVAPDDGPAEPLIGGPGRWLVRRPDGRTVAALVYRLGAPAALDVYAAASAEEAAVLRLVVASLTQSID